MELASFTQDLAKQLLFKLVPFSTCLYFYSHLVIILIPVICFRLFISVSDYKYSQAESNFKCVKQEELQKVAYSGLTSTWPVDTKFQSSRTGFG